MIVDQIDSDIEVTGEYKTSKHANTKYAHTKDSKYVHRTVMARMLGRPLKRNEIVDHINGDGLDNRRCNLRLCTHAENMANTGSYKNSSSQYKGVTFFKRDGNWQAKICPKGKTIHLGYYSQESEAALAYNYAAKHYFGDFAKFNEVHA
jgi:hypothetical protein